MSKPKTSLLIASVLAALGIGTGTYVARQIVMVSPPPIMPAGPGPSEPSDLIPEARLTAWTPSTYTGVPGGIPTNRTQCVTTECAAVTGAASGYKDGTLDAKALLQAAITSAPANTYVLVPAGTWKVLSSLVFNHARDSVTLRGASMTTTIIDCQMSGLVCIDIGDGSDYLWAFPASGNDVTAYADSGVNTVLTMADTTDFATGMLVRFEVEDDATLPVINVFGYKKNRMQMSRVVSKTPTTLTVFPPIYGYERFAGLDAVVHGVQLQTDLVGIEDLTIECGNGSVIYSIIWIQTYAGWMKNVLVSEPTNYNVSVSASLMFEMRRSHIAEGKVGGSNGAGLLTNYASALLIEDNIFTDQAPNIETNGGTSGSVIAYNFLHNTSGWHGIDTNHGPHNSFNLIEGNVSSSLISDGYFGGESELTIYRNLIHGNYIDAPDTDSYCISLKRFARNVSIVGNLLGGPLLSVPCTTSLGTPNIGNGSSFGTAQPSLADYWADWTPAGERTTLAGTLTTRTDDLNGVITLSSGATKNGHVLDIWSTAGVRLARVTVTSMTHPALTVLSGGSVLPALSTSLVIWAGPGDGGATSAAGFQELDLDVAATAVQKANHDAFTDAVTGDLDGATLPDSLFRSAKPSWFNSMTWPPVDPFNPVHDYEIIPAGYRYMNAGSDPP